MSQSIQPIQAKDTMMRPKPPIIPFIGIGSSGCVGRYAQSHLSIHHVKRMQPTRYDESKIKIFIFA